jgi:hypothetical protein
LLVSFGRCESYTENDPETPLENSVVELCRDWAVKNYESFRNLKKMEGIEVPELEAVPGSNHIFRIALPEDYAKAPFMVSILTGILRIFSTLENDCSLTCTADEYSPYDAEFIDAWNNLRKVLNGKCPFNFFVENVDKIVEGSLDGSDEDDMYIPEFLESSCDATEFVFSRKADYYWDSDEYLSSLGFVSLWTESSVRHSVGNPLSVWATNLRNLISSTKLDEDGDKS